MGAREDWVWVLEGFQNQYEVTRWILTGVDDNWVRGRLGLTDLAADLWDVPERVVKELDSILSIGIDLRAYDHFLIGREQVTDGYGTRLS